MLRSQSLDHLRPEFSAAFADDGPYVALVILQTISSGFNLLGYSQHLTVALWGFTLIAVMAAKRLTGVFVTRYRS